MRHWRSSRPPRQLSRVNTFVREKRPVEFYNTSTSRATAGFSFANVRRAGVAGIFILKGEGKAMLEAYAHACRSRPGEIDLSIVHDRGDVGVQLSIDETAALIDKLQAALDNAREMKRAA